MNDRLGNLLWDKVSVGLTEEEIINSLKRSISRTEDDQYESDEDPEEKEARFPIFRSAD